MSDLPEDEPPPIVRTNLPPSDDGDEGQWELFDAQDQSKKLRATFATRLYVEPSGEHLRLSFGERISDETVYQTAIVVPNEVAIEMAQLMYQMATLALEAKMARLRNLTTSSTESKETDSDG